MYQREALWVAFEAAYWRPSAVQIGIGGINAVSGQAWEEVLSAEPQNYVVCPEQPWLDGVKAGPGLIRQFVAMALGSRRTVESQLTAREQVGGIQIRVYQPRPGRFPDRPPPQPDLGGSPLAAPMEMGLGVGGQMQQQIYPDRHGLETWDLDACTELSVHLVNSQQYEQITGEPMPSTPVSAEAYTRAGLPWFRLYDEGKGDVETSRRLKGVRSVSELDRQEGTLSDDPSSLEVPENQIRNVRASSNKEEVEDDD